MGQAARSVVAARKMVERPAGLNKDVPLRQFLCKHVFDDDFSVLDNSFPFHSFPVLSQIVEGESFVASIGSGYPLPYFALQSACWEFPKPLISSLTTHTT